MEAAGQEVVQRMEAVGTDSGAPRKPVLITACGELKSAGGSGKSTGKRKEAGGGSSGGV